MTLESRGRRAGAEFRRSLDQLEASRVDRPRLFEFERFGDRKQRNRRLGAGLLAAAATVAIVVFVSKAFSTLDRAAPARPGLGGLILYGDWNARRQQADWYTVRPDGSGVHDLKVSATCAVWFPDGMRILITDDGAVGPGRPLRPATVDPDGSNLRPLDGVANPDLNLGCGDVSPDGTRIALEGFGQRGHSDLDGIYSVRASDGGGLTRLVEGPVSAPRYSPDGTHLSFFDTKEGVSPTGSGALFVMRADGMDIVRITPWGYAFDVAEWSPDGRWIVFQRPYGQLYVVRPDGSQLHRVPLRLPQGAGALNPAWSPDGRWIVFSLQLPHSAEIHMVQPDGTGLRTVSALPGAQLQGPDWEMHS